MNDNYMLFAMPSFLKGIARAIDIFGGFTEYNISKTNQEADGKALFSDLRAVYTDMNEAYKRVKSYNEARG